MRWQKYDALESFETYKRNSSTSIHDFLTEFEKRYRKIKKHGTIWSDDLLAYRLLKSANLTIPDEQLVKATIGELKYDIVKTKLLTITVKILIIRIKNSLQNPHVAQTITRILSSTETEKPSHKKTKHYTKCLDAYNGHPHNHNQITQFGELPSKNLHEDYNPNQVKIP